MKIRTTLLSIIVCLQASAAEENGGPIPRMQEEPRGAITEASIRNFWTTTINAIVREAKACMAAAQLPTAREFASRRDEFCRHFKTAQYVTIGREEEAYLNICAISATIEEQWIKYVDKGENVSWTRYDTGCELRPSLAFTVPAKFDTSGLKPTQYLPNTPEVATEYAAVARIEGLVKDALKREVTTEEWGSVFSPSIDPLPGSSGYSRLTLSIDRNGIKSLLQSDPTTVAKIDGVAKEIVAVRMRSEIARQFASAANVFEPVNLTIPADQTKVPQKIWIESLNPDGTSTWSQYPNEVLQKAMGGN